MANRSIDILIKARDLSAAQLSKVQRGFDGLKASVLSLRGVLGGLALGATIRSAVQAFQEDEAAQTRLATALKLVGDTSAEALRRQKEFASEIQRLTVLGDEAVLNLQALGASLGRLSGQQLQDATKAAIGLSRALGIDATAAMRLVARAAVGDTSALSRYGIKLSETLSPQEKFNELLRIGAENFKLATAEAQTSAGQYQQLLNAIGDTAEIVGQKIVRAFTEAGDAQQSAVQRLTSAIQEFNDGLSTIDAAREVVRAQRRAAGQSEETTSERILKSPFRLVGRAASGLAAGFSGGAFLPEAPSFPSPRGNDRGENVAPEIIAARQAILDRRLRLSRSRLAGRDEDAFQGAFVRQLGQFTARFNQSPAQFIGQNVTSGIEAVKQSIAGGLTDVAQNIRQALAEQGAKERSRLVREALRDTTLDILKRRAEAGDKEASLQLQRLEIQEAHNKTVIRLTDILRNAKNLTADQASEIRRQITESDRATRFRLASLDADKARGGSDRQATAARGVAAVEARFLARAPGQGADPVAKAVEKGNALNLRQAKGIERMADDIEAIKTRLTVPVVVDFA